MREFLCILLRNVNNEGKYVYKEIKEISIRRRRMGVSTQGRLSRFFKSPFRCIYLYDDRVIDT